MARLPIGLILAAPLAFGLLALLPGQDANWDLRNYHYWTGYALLSGRHGFDDLVGQLPSFYNPTLDVPVYWLAQFLPAKGVAFALGLVHGLNAPLLFLIARRLQGSPWWALVLALLGMTRAGAWGELGAVMHDNVVSLGFLSALALIVTAQGMPSRRRALLAGLAMGLAVGLKLTTALYAVALCLAFFILEGTWRLRFERAFLFGLAVLAGYAVTGLHWNWHLWTSYGNPVFPLMNDLFQSPMALPKPYRETGFLPKNPAEALLFPFLFSDNGLRVGEADFRELAVAFAYLLVPVGALWGLRRNGWESKTRFLMLTLAIAYLLWLKMFAIYRYLIGIEMLTPLAILLALRTLPIAACHTTRTAVVLLAIIAATSRPPDWIHVPWGPRFIDIQLPPIDQPERTMIVMAGHEPSSFLIPAFPPVIPFLRIDSQFTNPLETGNGFNARMKARIDAHAGTLLVLYYPDQRPDVMEKLEQVGLGLEESACRPVTANIAPGPFALCPAVRPPMGGKG